MNGFIYLFLGLAVAFALLVTYAVVGSSRQSRQDAAQLAESRHNTAAHAADGYPPTHQPGHGWQQQA
jgi:hypothetical protein